MKIDERTREAIEMVRAMGKQHFRPLGIEADRLARPVPADHPLYQLIAQSGFMARGIESRDERDAGGDASGAGGSGSDGGGSGDGASGSGDGASGSGGGHADGRPHTGPAVRNVLVAEEGSYWDRGVMVSLPGPGLGGPPLSRMGTPEQKERFFAPFRQRERPAWAAFAMTEPGAGSDVARIETRAVADRDEWVLNGHKSFSSNSPRADWVLVFATIDPALGRAGHRAFIVEKGTPGFEILRLEKKMGLRAYETASFVLDDCRIPATNLLGGEDYYEERAKRGFKGAMETFNATRPMVAAMGVGIARAALDIARDFTRDEIAAHAAARRRRAEERIAEIRRSIELSRLLCVRAAALLDAGKPNSREAAIAKLYAPPAAATAIQTAAEVLGEAGFEKERLIEKFAREAKAIDIVEGTQQVQRRIVSRSLIGDLG